MEMGRGSGKVGWRGKTQEDPGSCQEGCGPGSWEGREARPAQGVLEWRAGGKEGRDGGKGAAMGQGKKAGRGGERPREGEEAAGTGVPRPEAASSICSARCGATDIPGRGF